MKNFLAILGCFSLAIIMIIVFASCGRRDDITVSDPDDGIVEQATESDIDTDTDTDSNIDDDDEDADTDEKTTNENEEQKTGKDTTTAGTSGTGSSFLDTVLGGVEDVVGEALGGAANVVEEALAGAADKVNSALNDENKNN